MQAIFVNGLQGAGKGVQGRLLAERGFTHLVASEALSAPAYKDMVATYVSNGQLVPDEIVLSALKEYVEEMTNPANNLVLDGYMRTSSQAEGMIKYLQDMGYSIVVLLFVLPENVAINRALLRGRKDDTTEKLKVRFKGYYDHLGGVLATVAQCGYSIHVVNTEGLPESIHLEICNIAGVKTDILAPHR